MKRRTIIGLIAGLAMLGGVHSGVLSLLTKQALSQGDIATAAKRAQTAEWFPKALSLITFNKVPDLVGWYSLLDIISDCDELLSTTQSYVNTAFSDKSANAQHAYSLTQHLNHLSKKLDVANQSIQQSLVLKRVLSEGIIQKIATAHQAVLTIQPLLDGEHTYVLLLQNTHELRATGGFMGTYAIATLTDGSLQRFEIQDMYVPDGQFTGFVEAPAGVKEYLSSGNGMRLPDANWHPDFPSSAKQVLSFFALSGEQNIEGVIAINLPAVENILKVVGPVQVADYETTVTAESFASIARSNRDEFFPGSQQKKHFMSSFFNQLIIAIEKLQPSQYEQLFTSITASAKHKDILLYSQDKQLQDIFTKLAVDGAIHLEENAAFYFQSVESNVGINKANRNIERAISLKINETDSTATIVLTNGNSPPTAQELSSLAPTEAKHLGYVDYQRVLVLPTVNVDSIEVGDETITTWDKEVITTDSGDQLKQIGFLVTVPEQQQRIVRVRFSHPPLPPKPIIQIDKQPGVASIPYQISIGNVQHQLKVDSTVIIN